MKMRGVSPGGRVQPPDVGYIYRVQTWDAG